jgi:hypothetical protein
MKDLAAALNAYQMRLFLLPLLFLTRLSYAQEMESDLYSALNTSSLSIFMASEHTTMNVVTYRASKNLGLVIENESTYRKGKINPERINFTTTYTEYFMLDDRKKSIGRYELFPNSDIYKYERTDFNQRNIRTYTFYHTYRYENSIQVRELIRTKEYVGTGSVEMDTVVTIDSVNYEVSPMEGGFKQQNLSQGGVTTEFFIDGGKLVKEISRLTGFSEENVFTYDANEQLVKIENTLVGEDGQRITTYTQIRYSIDGLITEAIFYDQNNEVLEKKVFTYK